MEERKASDEGVVRVRPDARKSLAMLRSEWQDCTACELGARRVAYKGEFVFGEGRPHGIMFIGEGPGEKEEALGRPFVGPSGRLLRDILSRLGVTDCYITNLVTCRSCAQATTADGEPIFFPGRGGAPPEPRWQDQPPSPAHWRACMSRMHQEIYQVDPHVIVTLGGVAAEALLGKKIAITQNRGQPERLTIPGALFSAVLPGKKQKGLRKEGGRGTAPTEQNMVHYYCLPTVHPAWVARKLADMHPDESPFQKLVGDIRMAVKVYEDFMLRTYDRVPSGASDATIEALRGDSNDEASAG